MSAQSWHRLQSESDLAEGEIKVHAVGGWQVLLARSEGELVAINDRCTHQAARLSTGRIRRGAVMCPLHGARFELASGRCLGGAYPAVRRFELRVEEGMVEVLVPDAAPSMEETAISIS